MANFLDTAKIPLGAKPKHKFPLHRSHPTTASFMQFHVAMARELAAHSTYKGNHQTFIRTIALKKPLLTSIQVHNTALFVPFRTVWEPFSDFITDVPHNQPAGTGIINNVPLLYNAQVWQFLTSNACSSVVSSGAFDFTYGGNNRKFTAFGRYVYSTFVQLGYKWNPTAKDDYSKSALPLLCLAKAYIDFYFPSGYAHYGVYATIDGIMQRHVTYNLTAAELATIFSAIWLVSYDSDYFVSAFDNPAGPNTGTSSLNFSILDATNYTNAVLVENGSATDFQGNPNGTPSIPIASGDNLTQYNLDTLHRLESYVRRHQLAGSRSLERYLADWGVVLSADKLRRCIKLEESKFPFQVGEVMSMSDTLDGNGDGAQLGDYAGRAVAYDGDLNFEFSTDEFGYLFVISTIIPQVGYTQGIDRFVNHKTKLDFLSSFDGVGTQPITQEELFVGLKRSSNGENKIFGFTGRSAEYKTVKDVLSGTFLFPSVRQGLLGWETMRLFSDETTDAEFDLSHSLDFMLGGDAIQFNRIFLDDDSMDDPFVLIHRDNFELIQPAVQLFDIYEWDDPDRPAIKMQANGVKTN